MNFAPTVLNVPKEVNVRKVDLALELQILSYYEQCRNNEIHVSASGDKTESVSA